jgi:hypothetical protein
MSQNNFATRLIERAHSWYRVSWATALFFAAPITLLFLGLLAYCFAIADRYRVFLYDHDMGPLAYFCGKQQ